MAYLVQRCHQRRGGPPGCKAPPGAHVSELVGPRARARLVVLAGEVDGRCSGETLTCLRLLDDAKSHSEPPLLRRRAVAWRLRWTHTLSFAVAQAFAGLQVGVAGLI